MQILSHERDRTPRNAHWLALAAVAALQCGCVHRGAHAIHRMWADYNTLGACALYFEQEDHLPYHQARVGHTRWMYNKDPGHQLAALGNVPACAPCDPWAGEDPTKPFESEIAVPAGIPRQTGSMWGSNLPEPINVSQGQPLAGWPGSLVPPAPNSEVPSPEQFDGSDSQPQPPGAPPAEPVAPPPSAPPVERPKPVPLPAAPPKPAIMPTDEAPRPMIGPTSDGATGTRLTSGQAPPSSQGAP